MLRLLPVLVVSVLSTACSKPPALSSSTMFAIQGVEAGWAESVEYRTDGDGTPKLILDGIRFELCDPSVYRVDWEAIGISGVSTVSSLSYSSTERANSEPESVAASGEPALLSVSGKPLHVREGILHWGELPVGPVKRGDVVIIDADGPRIQNS